VRVGRVGLEWYSPGEKKILRNSRVLGEFLPEGLERFFIYFGGPAVLAEGETILGSWAEGLIVAW